MYLQFIIDTTPLRNQRYLFLTKSSKTLYQFFFIFFKFQATKLKEYSRILPNDKFYFLGVKGGYRIGLTFSPYAKSIINPSDIIFVEESGQYRGPGELEAQFNYLWKPNLKLEKKTLDSSYILNGNFNQITRPLLFLN